MFDNGRLVGIYTCGSAGAAMVSCDDAELRLREGVAGDRYATKAGTWRDPSQSSDVTLFAEESLAPALESGIDLRVNEVRRNLITRGLDLNELIGKTFRVGSAVLHGDRECAPCGYLETITEHPGLRDALKGRGGLRATILTGGTVRVGDTISVVDDVAAGAG